MNLTFFLNNLSKASNGFGLVDALFIMETKELKTFLDERESLNISSFCRESGISKAYLYGMLNGEYNLTEKVESKLIPIMQKYGRSI